MCFDSGMKYDRRCETDKRVSRFAEGARRGKNIHFTQTIMSKKDSMKALWTVGRLRFSVILVYTATNVVVFINGTSITGGIGVNRLAVQSCSSDSTNSP